MDSEQQHAKIPRLESVAGLSNGAAKPPHTDGSNDTHSEDDEHHIHHDSAHSDNTDSHPHPHHKEHVEFALREGEGKFRVFLGDDVTLVAPFPPGSKVVWKHDSDPMPDSTCTLQLHDFTTSQLGTYTAACEGLATTCTAILSKNKSPFKWCDSCDHRNHAHAKHCIQCHQPLHAKARPPKRRCESLTMKNYEDAITEKLNALKEAHGDKVDTLFIISRRHYNRTLTVVHKSAGAATAFLQQASGQTTLERALSDAWTRAIDQYHLSTGTGVREPRRRDGSASRSVSPPGIQHGLPQASLAQVFGSIDPALAQLARFPPAAPSAVYSTYQNGLDPSFVGLDLVPPVTGSASLQSANMPPLLMDPGVMTPSLPALTVPASYASWLQAMRGLPDGLQPSDRS
eukprot:m.17092 g.17092  ORF g.17092 m.17092 type:complete len:400 (-) comp3206_c0_seq1:118-1317(-)